MNLEEACVGFRFVVMEGLATVIWLNLMLGMVLIGSLPC